MSKSSSSVTWFLLPFIAIWNLLTFFLNLTGRIILAVLGVVLMIVGLVLTLLIIAAPIGIPFIIIGFLLILRSLF